MKTAAQPRKAALAFIFVTRRGLGVGGRGCLVAYRPRLPGESRDSCAKGTSSDRIGFAVRRNGFCHLRFGTQWHGALDRSASHGFVGHCNPLAAIAHDPTRGANRTRAAARCVVQSHGVVESHWFHPVYSDICRVHQRAHDSIFAAWRAVFVVDGDHPPGDDHRWRATPSLQKPITQ
jgi:hypothetical protein